MNAERLLAHYEQIGDALDAIVRLRRFILDLAVRGKLVPQDPNDEPAVELLKRIAKAKSEQKKKTGDARIKIEPDPMPDELEMALPRGWAVQSFENLFLFFDYRGNTPPKTDSGIPLITAKNIRMGHLNREPREYISKATFKTWMTRGFPKIGDLFFTTEAPLANICLNDIEEPFALAQRAICFQPYAKIDTKFLMLALMSNVMQSLIDKHATGMTAKGIKAAKLKPLPIPIPPLAEQRRIVAKVDELMGLCDGLEAARGSREAVRDRLTAASLARLNAPDPKTFLVDASFVLDALPALTTRPDQIKQLRQTILNLAVRGKLVEQDTSDEPAAESLKRLKKARSDLEAAGKIRKERGEAPSHYGGEQGFELPGTWSWARLTEIGQTQTGTSPSSGSPDLFGDFMPFIKPADLDGNQINYDGQGLSEIGVAHSRLAASNSILMVCIGATLGKVNTTSRAVCFNQQINSLTPFLDGLTAFIALALKASDFQSLAWSKAGTGTLPIISKGKWEVLPIPLPPLTEQHRIVAKVDALMVLCDRLEANLTATAATRRRLLDAMLAEALAPAEERELEAAE